MSRFCVFWIPRHTLPGLISIKRNAIFGIHQASRTRFPNLISHRLSTIINRQWWFSRPSVEWLVFYWGVMKKGQFFFKPTWHEISTMFADVCSQSLLSVQKKNWAEMEQKFLKTWFSFNSHQPGRRKYQKNLEAWIKWTPLCWCMLRLWSQQKFKGLVIHLSSKAFHFHQFPFYSSKYNLTNPRSQKSPQQCCIKLVYM